MRSLSILGNYFTSPFFNFIGNFVPIKLKELNARAKFSTHGGNAHGRNKVFCFFLPPYINLKLPANLEAVAAKLLCSYSNVIL